MMLYTRFLRLAHNVMYSTSILSTFIHGWLMTVLLGSAIVCHIIMAKLPRVKTFVFRLKNSYSWENVPGTMLMFILPINKVIIRQRFAIE